MLIFCAAPLTAASSSTTAKDSANRISGTDACVRRMREDRTTIWCKGRTACRVAFTASSIGYGRAILDGRSGRAHGVSAETIEPSEIDCGEWLTQPGRRRG